MQTSRIIAQAPKGIVFDHDRVRRTGLPEAVFCEGKPRAAVLTLLQDFAESGEPVLFTRLDAEIFSGLPKSLQAAWDYHTLSRTAFNARLPHKAGVSCAVVSAGTADGAVTWEAARTLDWLGIETRVWEDCGVAGLWRLLDRVEDIEKADAVIVAAGLDAALASVLGGLVSKPVFAVPTPVGYGAARGGETALSSMLASCAQGISVLNIGNGFGAACAAARVLSQLSRER
ncbi:MAG: nickel pincer cofactor biosynthesis protein LarB, partial [Desulfovibrionaceae bacterium]|nr:nickel pincer cofactor biosynthesis protein LarB [Desulfovibrionaceae bacterium]